MCKLAGTHMSRHGRHGNVNGRLWWRLHGNTKRLCVKRTYLENWIIQNQLHVILIVTICLFLLSHRSSDASLLFWTNFSSSFVDALRLNSASLALRRAWPILTLRFHGRLLLHVQHVALPTSLLSHGPLTLYIRLSFSATDTAWSVRRVSIYIRRLLLYLYL